MEALQIHVEIKLELDKLWEICVFGKEGSGRSTCSAPEVIKLSGWQFHLSCAYGNHATQPTEVASASGGSYGRVSAIWLDQDWEDTTTFTGYRSLFSSA